MKSFLTWYLNFSLLFTALTLFFYQYSYGNCSDELYLVHRLSEFKRRTRLVTISHCFTVEITRYY